MAGLKKFATTTSAPIPPPIHLPPTRTVLAESFPPPRPISPADRDDPLGEYEPFAGLYVFVYPSNNDNVIEDLADIIIPAAKKSSSYKENLLIRVVEADNDDRVKDACHRANRRGFARVPNDCGYVLSGSLVRAIIGAALAHSNKTVQGNSGADSQ